MELTDPDVLEAMLLTLSGAQPKRQKLSHSAEPVDKPAVHQTHMVRAQAKRRCTCGACSTCVENARWERIFQEKFADPNYYTRSPLRQDSSRCW